MPRPILIGSAVGVPLAIGLAVLANSVELGRALIIALSVGVVAVAALVGAHLEYERRHIPPARTHH